MKIELQKKNTSIFLLDLFTENAGLSSTAHQTERLGTMTSDTENGLMMAPLSCVFHRSVKVPAEC